MTVRKRKWKDRFGRMRTTYTIDVQIQRPNGVIERVQKASPVDTLRGALDFERQVRNEILGGGYNKPKIEIPTFDGFSERFLAWSAAHNKPSTVYAKEWVIRLHLSPAFGKMQLDVIRASQIEQFKATKLKEELNPKSVNNQLAVLRKMLNLAHEWEIIPSAPRIKALKTSLPTFEFATFDEMPRLVTALDPMWQPMAKVAWHTGLRLGELLSLKWSDIDLVAGRLVVRRTAWRTLEVTPKSGKTREIPLSDGCIATLRSIRHLRGEYVFSHDDGTRLSHSEVKDVMPRACRKAGLAKRLTWHDLRHTFASHLVMKGASLKSVQELLGHSSIDMTMRYAHLSPKVRRDAVQLLDDASNDAVAAHSHVT